MRPAIEKSEGHPRVYGGCPVVDSTSLRIDGLGLTGTALRDRVGGKQ